MAHEDWSVFLRGKYSGKSFPLSTHSAFMAAGFSADVAQDLLSLIEKINPTKPQKRKFDQDHARRKKVADLMKNMIRHTLVNDFWPKWYEQPLSWTLISIATPTKHTSFLSLGHPTKCQETRCGIANYNSGQRLITLHDILGAGKSHLLAAVAGRDRVEENQKAVLLTLLDKNSENHFNISSSTANYQHGAFSMLRSTSEKFLKLYGGLGEDYEKSAWWKQEEEAQKFCRNLLLFMRDEQSKFRDGANLVLFHEAVMACLTGEDVSPDAWDLLDWRFFYVVDGHGAVTSDFVRQIASQAIRTNKGHRGGYPNHYIQTPQ
ncbi:hypothetical protein K440DRAFT_662782 [Wilcoxina mikolae CBS 423.85]|nr:hypothetical protein K440DRAFT_662782 [Wilcoxina mikolae CBS 423.85]